MLATRTQPALWARPLNINWVGLAASLLSPVTRTLLNDLASPRVAKGARTEVEAQFQAGLIKAVGQAQVRNNFPAQQLQQSLEQIAAAFPGQSFDWVHGENTYGQMLLAYRRGVTLIPLIVGTEVLANPLQHIQTQQPVTTKVQKTQAQKQVRDAFSTALQQARSANEQLTAMQGQAAELQAQVQKLMSLYVQQATGGGAARGKLSQTVAQMEKVLKAQRALYAQANAPVAALKQVQTQTRMQAVADWARAANEWRTELSRQIKHLVSNVEQGYSYLKSLKSKASTAARQAESALHHSEPSASPSHRLPELGRSTSATTISRLPDLTSTVRHTKQIGTAGEIERMSLQKKIEALLQARRNYYDQRRTLLPWSDLAVLAKDVYDNSDLPALGVSFRAFQASLQAGQGVDGASGAQVRAGAGGDTGGLSGDVLALKSALQALSDPKPADLEQEQAQNLARRVLPDSASNQLFKRLAQEIRNYAKSEAEKPTSESDALQILYQIELGLSSAESDNSYKKAVAQMLKKLLEEASFSSQPNADVYQLVVDLLQEQWGWINPPGALLDALVQNQVQRLEEVLAKMQVGSTSRLSADELASFNRENRQTALRSLRGERLGQGTINPIVPRVVASLLANENSAIRGTLQSEFSSYLSYNRSPLLDSDGNPTFVAVNILRQLLISRIRDLTFDKRNGALQQAAFNQLLDHIIMFSDEYTFNSPDQSNSNGYPLDTVLQAFGSSKVWTHLASLSTLLSDIKSELYQKFGFRFYHISPLELSGRTEIQTWMELVAKEWEEFAAKALIRFQLGSVQQWTGLGRPNSRQAPALNLSDLP